MLPKNNVKWKKKLDGIPFKYSPGVRYTGEGKERFTEFCQKYCIKSLKGIVLAHLRALHTASRTPGNTIIMEDDAFIKDNFVHSFELIHKYLKNMTLSNFTAELSVIVIPVYVPFIIGFLEN